MEWQQQPPLSSSQSSPYHRCRLLSSIASIAYLPPSLTQDNLPELLFPCFRVLFGCGGCRSPHFSGSWNSRFFFGTSASQVIFCTTCILITLLTVTRSLFFPHVIRWSRSGPWPRLRPQPGLPPPRWISPSHTNRVPSSTVNSSHGLSSVAFPFHLALYLEFVSLWV